MSSPTVITTPHNQDGISVFGKNLAVKSLNPRVGLIYSTSSNGKVDLTNDKEHAAHDPSALIPEEGSAVMVAEWPPGSEPRMHRTLTVDMGVMTAGEIELILDSGKTRILKPRDVLVHRRTMHGWRNRSTTETARMICFVLPSEPVAGIKY